MANRERERERERYVDADADADDDNDSYDALNLTRAAVMLLLHRRGPTQRQPAAGVAAKGPDGTGSTQGSAALHTMGLWSQQTAHRRG